MFKYLFTGLLCLCSLLCLSQQEVFPALGGEYLQVNQDSTLSADIISLTVRDNARVILNWRVASEENEYFTVERSATGKDFETVAVIKYSTTIDRLEWIDEKPIKGKNIYRIKYSFLNGVQWYSKSVVAVVNGLQSFRFYPNPAKEMIILRSEQPIDISIIDRAGKARISQTLESGLQTLNISSLENGVYILRVYNRQTNNYFLERLVKN